MPRGKSASELILRPVGTRGVEITQRDPILILLVRARRTSLEKDPDESPNWMESNWPLE